MDSGRDRPWKDAFVLARDFRSVGDHSTIYRAVGQKQLIRVTTGAYLPAAIWARLDGDARRLALIDANGLLFPHDGPYSHLAAAALWGLPNVGPWPTRLEVWAPEGIELRSRRGVQRRSGPPDPHALAIDGHRVTGLARTIVDVARTNRFAVGVAMADRALSPRPTYSTGVARFRVARENLEAEVIRLADRRGIVRAGQVVEFADGLSESPGESVSRAAMRALGFPAPTLQHPFSDADGFVGRVDFWWPDFGVIGEFDGRGKYLRADLLGGLSIADAVVDEKQRENRLRALGLGVARWEWSDVRSPRRVEAILARSGLPQRRRRPTPERS